MPFRLRCEISAVCALPAFIRDSLKREIEDLNRWSLEGCDVAGSSLLVA